MKNNFIAILSFIFVIGGFTSANAVEVKEVKSKSGITAWLIEDHTNPVISLHFTFKGGAAMDPIAKEGLANMVSGLLDEGAGDLDSQSFQARLEDDAIALHFNAAKDSFSGTLKTLSQNLESATELLNLSLSKPRFDVEPIERIRAQILASIRNDMSKPGTKAFDALFAKMFAGHGYGRRTDGTAESVARIKRQDLIDLHKNMLARKNLVVGAAGDITPQELAKFLDAAFGQLRETPNITTVLETKPKESGDIKIIEMDVPQSVIVFAGAGVKRDDPDYYAALVMNHILGGGGFTSRLYDEVREKRGLAYSISSNIYSFDHSSVIVGQAGTENSRVGETVKIIKDEWSKMSVNGATAAEVKDAKTYISGAFPLRFTSSDAIAGILVGMQVDNLGLDYLDKRKSYIGAVSVSDVQKAAKRILRPELLDVFIVGKPGDLSAIN
ncbi:MAG: insulinase family protein [Rhodospirillaceae bacterium]|nr:insulinase family protein [Rhodospirillaceae bacterium]